MRPLRIASINTGTSLNPERMALRLVRDNNADASHRFVWIDATGGRIDDCYGATVARAVESLVLAYSLSTWDLRLGKQIALLRKPVTPQNLTGAQLLDKAAALTTYLDESGYIDPDSGRTYVFIDKRVK